MCDWGGEIMYGILITFSMYEEPMNAYLSDLSRSHAFEGTGIRTVCYITISYALEFLHTANLACFDPYFVRMELHSASLLPSSQEMRTYARKKQPCEFDMSCAPQCHSFSTFELLPQRRTVRSHYR